MSVFPTRILLATDGSENAAVAAATAVELAQKTDSELHVVHVETDIPTFLSHMEIDTDRISRQATELLREQVRKIETAGVSVAGSHMRTGNAAEQIVTLSEELRAGMVVVGSRGLSVWKRAVMGSVSNEVVRHAHCPVVVVRDEKPRV